MSKQHLEVIEQYRLDAASDERMIKNLCAQLDRITAERDAARKALKEIATAHGSLGLGQIVSIAREALTQISD